MSSAFGEPPDSGVQQVGRRAGGQREDSREGRREGEREDAAAGAGAGWSQGGRHSIHAAVICFAPLPGASRAVIRPGTRGRASRGTRPRPRRSRADARHLLLDAAPRARAARSRPGVQPGVELALGAGVGARRPGRQRGRAARRRRRRTRRRAGPRRRAPSASAVGARHAVAEQRHLASRARRPRARQTSAQRAAVGHEADAREARAMRYADSAATSRSQDERQRAADADGGPVDRRDDRLGHRPQAGEDRVVDGRQRRVDVDVAVVGAAGARSGRAGRRRRRTRARRP